MTYHGNRERLSPGIFNFCDLAPKFYPSVSSLLAVGFPCRAV
jgi:hypothetical protein